MQSKREVCFFSQSFLDGLLHISITTHSFILRINNYCVATVRSVRFGFSCSSFSLLRLFFFSMWYASVNFVWYLCHLSCRRCRHHHHRHHHRRRGIVIQMAPFSFFAYLHRKRILNRVVQKMRFKIVLKMRLNTINWNASLNIILLKLFAKSEPRRKNGNIVKFKLP